MEFNEFVTFDNNIVICGEFIENNNLLSVLGAELAEGVDKEEEDETNQLYTAVKDALNVLICAFLKKEVLIALLNL